LAAADVTLGRLDDRIHRNTPTVSILTPSFNQAKWLGDNLRSVASQTYPNLEQIVMDGRSTDGSVDLLRQAQPQVRWQSEPDEGQSHALNKAFEQSTGEIIGWLNSDDAYFSRGVVEQVVGLFETDPRIGVIYGHGALMNAAGLLLHVLWAPPFSVALLRTLNFISQPTVFVRRRVITRPFFVDPDCDYMMDRELWLHLASRTRFHRLDRIIAVDRHHRMKKSYTRLDLAAHDETLIRDRYALPLRSQSRILRRTLKFGMRLAGMSKVREAAQGGDAMAMEPIPMATLAFRQVAQFRRSMPSGE
jgi:glycosyltransferase involved in cell wall biosynthesis